MGNYILEYPKLTLFRDELPDADFIPGVFWRAVERFAQSDDLQPPCGGYSATLEHNGVVSLLRYFNDQAKSHIRATRHGNDQAMSLDTADQYLSMSRYVLDMMIA